MGHKSMVAPCCPWGATVLQKARASACVVPCHPSWLSNHTGLCFSRICCSHAVSSSPSCCSSSTFSASMTSSSSSSSFVSSLWSIATVILRGILGRYSVIAVPADDLSLEGTKQMFITHFGWIFSLLLAVTCHCLHRHRGGKTFQRCPLPSSLLRDPALPVIAYLVALEGFVTDCLRWVPVRPGGGGTGHALICFCGNFGILLLNSSWLSVDGGKTALDVLEKMVSVTMMRGAQSGGVVTFEPTHYNYKQDHNSSCPSPPPLKGVRSRVVNAKRTDLSQRIRRKIVRDNGTPSLFGAHPRLKGSNHPLYADNDNNARLVRGFFGHTRFATTSKASFDGTHPHQWSPRRNHTVFSSRDASPALLGVENFITHNGDFEFFQINSKYYDVALLQTWLEHVLHHPMPASVDSAAIAGVVDLLRTQGSFALSARYALCVGLPNSKVEMEPSVPYPTMEEYEDIAKTFENVLMDMTTSGNHNNNHNNHNHNNNHDHNQCRDGKYERDKLIAAVVAILKRKLEVLPEKDVGDSSTYHTPSSRRGKASPSSSTAISTLSKFLSSAPSEEEHGGGDLHLFVRTTVHAFFDNDLLQTAKLFLENAKGSFGLSISSSLDAHRQVVLAARGQTMSIAFYPKKGLVCYGSEQAAVKAGLNYETPGGNATTDDAHSSEADNAVRLDLDDLGGEICLLDWGYAGDTQPAVSRPNRNLPVETLMNGTIRVVLHHQSKTCRDCHLSQRLTLLERNEFVKPLLDDCPDPILADIRDIPRVCSRIQDDWHDVGLNRMTAWNLANCIRARMKARVDGTIESHGGQVDILVTGCEVSLWVAEQFVADLQKAFPRLFVRCVSSNKLLGLFGQELAMPCTGFPYGKKSLEMKDPIIIIVSHSGGTFGPLACSNLLQSFSSSIFAVTSEWDTQIGKQLRSMYSDDLLSSRIFSTEVGVRPAEPCSVSVVATHQLLTNIFEHICVTIISDPHFRHLSGAVITEHDLQILERCNQENLKALEEIVGVDCQGYEIHERRGRTEKELRSAGDLWSEHILENAKAYIMSFIYIVGTVTAGYPLVTGIATAAGLNTDWAFYITRFLDSLIYFWLPQINVLILRLIQGRNLRHRMVGRTVVIGDCPWVAQAAEAFLSKIFACSYSIAGLNVLSGNPADHLVHRHTHRVVRGSLLVCGRPDGRLSALTSLEASTCLSVNQASSIQSIGGTCESITIGHNKSKLPLSKRAIYLKSHRPLFLCEKVLDDIDAHEDLIRQRKEKIKEEKEKQKNKNVLISLAATLTTRTRSSITNTGNHILELSLSRSRQARQTRSSASLLGAYVNLEKDARKRRNQNLGSHIGDELVTDVINTMVKEKQGIENARRLFNEIDSDGNGLIELEEFIAAYQKKDANISREHLTKMFEEADIDEDGTLDFDEFLKVSKMPNLLAELSVKNRDNRGLVQVQASRERYFGEELRKSVPPGVNSMAMSQSQHFSMELYESRIASMQRFVAMTVMFHQMGMRVQTFFPKISFGLLGYRMDRTHSIMRIATTASPVSGADVRERMDELRLMLKIEKSVQLIERAWKNWKNDQKMIKA
mmetsp:Transcript_5059/g.10661  ORF Transcript_5059/g.10661 Transcript_5059/m.10661 type:complete len:1565 (-) Transcript_5059:323-5017(-)